MDTLRKFSAVFVLSAAILVLHSSDVFAQRVLDGQSVVNVQGSLASQTGLSIGWSKCDYLGQFVISANYLTDNAEKYLTEEEIMQAGDKSLRPYDLFASGGYMFRIVSTRSRSVMLYGGITLDLGYRGYDFKLYEQKENVDDDGFRTMETVSEDPYLKGHFIYGFSPEIGVQFFPLKKTAVSLFVKPRIRFNRMGNEPWFVPSAGLGVHFYI